MINVAAVMTAIRIELNRQNQLSKHDALCVYADNDDGWTIGVDGILDVQALAVAVVKRIEETNL